MYKGPHITKEGVTVATSTSHNLKRGTSQTLECEIEDPWVYGKGRKGLLVREEFEEIWGKNVKFNWHAEKEKIVLLSFPFQEVAK